MEIDKEKRLPHNYRTWWHFAGNLPDQDFLQATQGDNYPQFAPIPHNVHGRWETEIRPGVQMEEVFEIDAVTLKVRCFDEIRELLPTDKRDLMDWLTMAYCMVGQSGINPEKHPLVVFLNDLDKVLFPNKIQ